MKISSSREHRHEYSNRWTSTADFHSQQQNQPQGLDNKSLHCPANAVVVAEGLHSNTPSNNFRRSSNKHQHSPMSSHKHHPDNQDTFSTCSRKR